MQETLYLVHYIGKSHGRQPTLAQKRRPLRLLDRVPVEQRSPSNDRSRWKRTPSAFESGPDGGAEGIALECEMLGQIADIKEILEAAVGQAALHHRVQLFGDDGFPRIDSQQWFLISQQCWIWKLQSFGNRSISKAQIDLKRNPRRVQVSGYIHPNPTVKIFQADWRGLNGIKLKTVGFLELELRDFFEQLSTDSRLGRAEAEQIQILRGSRRVLRLPENVKHGAFEDEAVSVAAQAEAKQQTLQGIPDQRLVVDHSARLGKRQESRAYGSARVPLHSRASR